MKYHKIVLAGGNGYLGRVLADYYKDQADQVIILSRKAAAQNGNVKTLVWDGKTEGDWKSSLQDADLLVNLCGKNVNCRYTMKNQEEIIASRTVPTRLLNKVVGNLERPPKLWINVTSATIYRHAEDGLKTKMKVKLAMDFPSRFVSNGNRLFLRPKALEQGRSR